MPITILVRLLVAPTLVASAACTGALIEEDDPVDPVTEALALLDEPWCAPFAERFCAGADACGCAASNDWPTDCVAAMFAQCRRDLRIAADGLADGGFLVSRDGVPRCLELVDEAADRCDAPESKQFAVECRLVVPRAGEALPRAGEACPAGLCTRGLRCASDQFCRVPRPEGDRCNGDNDCEVPLVCRSQCVGCTNTCIQPAAPLLGSPCNPSFGITCGEGATCVASTRPTCQVPTDGICQSDSECPQGQACGGFGVPQCVPLPGLGDFCGDSFRCAPGLACDFRSTTCVAPPGRDEPCAGFEIGMPMCASGLACRDGLCKTPGQVGEVCNFGGKSCAAGLGCEFDRVGMTTCQPLRAADEPCNSDEICQAGLACSFATSTCQPRLPEGASCSSGVRCEGDLQCVQALPGEFLCARVEAVGDACNGICPTGLRCVFPDTESVCVQRLCGMLRL